jgi:hypothetical protein
MDLLFFRAAKQTAEEELTMIHRINIMDRWSPPIDAIHKKTTAEKASE